MLILGGFQQNHVTKVDKKVRQCEVLNIKTKKVYVPRSKYSIPCVVKEIIGLYKIGTEVEESFMSEAGDAKNEKEEVEDSSSRHKIEIIKERLVMIFMSTRNQIETQFIECHSILPEDSSDQKATVFDVRPSKFLQPLLFVPVNKDLHDKRTLVKVCQSFLNPNQFFAVTKGETDKNLICHRIEIQPPPLNHIVESNINHMKKNS